MREEMSSRIEFKSPKRHPPISKKTKKERLSWAKATKAYKWAWKKVIFIDEAAFRLARKGGVRKQWMIKGSNLYRPVLHQEGEGFTAIFAFSASNDMPTEVYICKTVNANTYKEFLQKKIKKKRRVPIAVMHDNAPSHRAHLTKKFCKDYDLILVKQPPYSPDMQPVEDVIAWIKKRVYGQNKVFTTVVELEKAVLSAFKEFKANRAFREKLAASMEGRIEKVIEAKGDWSQKSA